MKVKLEMLDIGRNQGKNRVCCGCNEIEETTEHVIVCEQVRILVKEDNPPNLNEMTDRRNLLQIYNYLNTYIKQRNKLQSDETTSEDEESSGTTRSSEKQ